MLTFVRMPCRRTWFSPYTGRWSQRPALDPSVEMSALRGWVHRERRARRVLIQSHMRCLYAPNRATPDSLVRVVDSLALLAPNVCDFVDSYRMT